MLAVKGIGSRSVLLDVVSTLHPVISIAPLGHRRSGTVVCVGRHHGEDEGDSAKGGGMISHRSSMNSKRVDGRGPSSSPTNCHAAAIQKYYHVRWHRSGEVQWSGGLDDIDPLTEEDTYDELLQQLDTLCVCAISSRRRERAGGRRPVQQS